MVSLLNPTWDWRPNSNSFGYWPAWYVPLVKSALRNVLKFNNNSQEATNIKMRFCGARLVAGFACLIESSWKSVGLWGLWCAITTSNIYKINHQMAQILANFKYADPFCLYRLSRLQWHRLEWQTAYSDTFGISPMICLLLNYICLQWQLVRVTLFWCPKGVTVTDLDCILIRNV